MKFTILRNEGGDAGGGGASGSGQAQGGDANAGAAGAAAGQSLLGGGAASAGSQGSGTAAAGAAAATQAAGQSQGAFDFRKLVGDDGSFVPDFHKSLPEELKGLEKFRSPKQLLDGYGNLEKLMGAKANAVVIPAPDAPREEWAPVLKKLGVPDKPEGYGLKPPPAEKMPPGLAITQEELNEFAGIAHELGLTPQQVAKLQEYDLGRTVKMGELTKAHVAQTEAKIFEDQKATLTKAWGAPGTPGFKKNFEMAGRAALMAGFSQEQIDGGDPLFRNASFVTAMAKLGAMMSEDQLVKGSATYNNPKREADKIMTDKTHPLYALYHKGDPATDAKVKELLRQAG